jgi:hypothetical protein
MFLIEISDRQSDDQASPIEISGRQSDDRVGEEDYRMSFQVEAPGPHDDERVEWTRGERIRETAEEG